MFKLARRRYLQEVFGGGSSCTGDCGQGRRCTCNPEREESAGKPNNREAQLPNGKTMTREDIICMAREAGMPYFYGTWEIANLDGLERFAALVAAHERPWVGLTDEEVQEIMEKTVANCSELDDFTGDTARLTWKNCEAKLKEKNT
jgi:hypothetical protein